jgi:hypothetical protein
MERGKARFYFADLKAIFYPSPVPKGNWWTNYMYLKLAIEDY